MYWQRCCRIISTLSTSSLSSSCERRKRSLYFSWKLSLRAQRRMTHKRLPVSAILPQGHALELNSVVEHLSGLQRIRDSLRPVTEKKVKTFPNLRQPKQREELLSSGSLQARGNLFPARSSAYFVAHCRGSLGSRRPCWECWQLRARSALGHL